jgi:hypothetical protein
LFRLSPSDAETPLFSTVDFFPDAETPLFNTFFLPTPKTLQSTISSPSFIDETTPSNNCFAFSFPLLKHHCQQPFIIFSDAETPLFTTLSTFSPMLKHHCSTLLTFSDAETPPINTFDFLPILKHHSSAVLHLQQLFRSSLLLKHQSFTIVCQQASTPSDYSSSF